MKIDHFYPINYFIIFTKVCSRGGDLSMLEVLTESGDSRKTRERITSILEEQRKTLRFAMSRPQVNIACLKN